MTIRERRAAAHDFAEEWIKEIKKGEVSENKDTDPFWLELLQKVFGIQQPRKFIKFQTSVMLEKDKGFIDAIIPNTKVLIEQKGPTKELSVKYLQADGAMLTPFEQGKRYADYLPVSKKPHWIIACNFKEFWIYDMDKTPFEPVKILLKDFAKNIHFFEFLTDGDAGPLPQPEPDIVKYAREAGIRVRKLYNALSKQYIDAETEDAKKSLNALCVRLVFCLYAEDADIFEKNQFVEYMKNNQGVDYGRTALINLFKILDTKEHKRKYEADDLLAFPYVNGGLFEKDDLEIPKFSDEIFLTLRKISEDFDWSSVSPTIFGAMFESTLNPVTRNTGGMHYTSEGNIHKVIDPLFLDDLKDELWQIKQIKVQKSRESKLYAFQEKLASIKILDPACGSGNFLTESYLSLRKLENEVIKELFGAQIALDVDCIKVSIYQFYGIEINDFAVKVAQTAMWIADNQMMQETQKIVHRNLEFLPLKANANIITANALRMDWADLVKPSELSYIIGNPPFAGKSTMSRAQKDDTLEVFKGWKNAGGLDYVANWFKVASDYIDGTPIRCALLATNSVCQGEQISILWKPLFEKIHFDFAYKTFKWENIVANMARVHCVILGFSQAKNSKPKLIFDEGNEEAPTIAKNINAYLTDAENVFVEKRNEPISNVSLMVYGSKPADGGNLILTPQEKNELLQKYPDVEKFIRPFMGAYDLINRRERYCLWLVNAEPYELKNNPELKQRIAQVKKMRLKSPAKKTQQDGKNIPHLFQNRAQPETDYLAVPEVSSGNRKYVPIGYLDKNVIASNLLYTVPNATLYEFGVIVSNVHMAWMRLLAGRLKSDYRYSNGLVYNTFVWCEPTEKQKEKIKQTAQKILDVREKHASSTYADLYDETSMPPDLRKAHEENDKAVMQAYGFDLNFSEADIVRELLNLYEQHKTK